ncbi:MAG TPA: EAL domain-containing protein [Methylovirgula sp.]|nr:EAL domain-containing protein [Methylovirgula sp.]
MLPERRSVAEFVVRHRYTIQDVLFVVCIIVLAFLAAYEFSFTGSVETEKRMEFQEMLVVGAIIIVLVLYLGWRRVKDQEREIKQRLTAERRAHQLAHTDPLTGLANRRELESAVRLASSAPPGAQEVHAVLMMDLNGFKRINDLFGHPEGDEVLIAVAHRLRAAARDSDIIARPGGDEFAVVARHLAGPQGAMNVAVRIVRQLEAPIIAFGHSHKVRAGIGIALIPRDGSTPEDIIRKADIALYRSKHDVRSPIHFFEEQMDQEVRERGLIERELGAAIGTQMLRPFYQPIVDLKTGTVVEFEALARWYHPVLGDVEPERFIPIAENSNLIRDLTDWLLRCAARDALRWPENVSLSFNISPALLRDQTLGLRILSILGEIGLSPHRLEIEITESALVRDLDAATEVLTSLRQAGIRIALDDFGTGYSSLYHLRNFKLDKIKIDRSFVHAMGSEAESAAIVRALTGLGNGLGLTITAEGIEESEEQKVLIAQGCTQGQGFLFSEPVPADETDAFFATAPVMKAPQMGS